MAINLRIKAVIQSTLILCSMLNIRRIYNLL
jgi:hypothetical protein